MPVERRLAAAAGPRWHADRIARTLRRAAGAVLIALASIACTSNVILRPAVPTGVDEVLDGDALESTILGDYSRDCIHPGDHARLAAAATAAAGVDTATDARPPSRDCSGHAVEVHSTYRLFFVEFDEQGRLRDDRQLETVFAFLNRRIACGSGLSLVTFVHGWRHDSAYHDSNVELAREVLTAAAKAETNGHDAAPATGCPGTDWAGTTPREVVGIYVGWRGKSLDGGGLPWIGEFWEWLSVWDRKTTAQAVAVGSVREFFSRIRALQAEANRQRMDCRPDWGDYYECKRVRLSIFGHSFGGLLVFNAISASLIESLALSEGLPTGDSPNCSTLRETRRGTRRFSKPPAQSENAAPGAGPRTSAIVGSFADLVVLINPALEGARFEALHQAVLRRARTAQGFCPNQRPVLVVITAENDFATRRAFPVMRWFSTLFENTHPIGNRGTEADQARHLEADESKLNAMGHIARFQTHVLRSRDQEARADPGFRTAIDRYCGTRLTDPVDAGLQACRCAGLAATPGGQALLPRIDPAARRGYCGVLLENLNTAQMLQSDIDPSLQGLTRAAPGQFLYAHPNWRRLHCGGSALSKLGAEPGLDADLSPAMRGRPAKAFARTLHGTSPVWVIRSHDTSLLDNHSGIRPPLLQLLQGLYREVSVDQFDRTGFADMAADVRERLATCPRR